MVRIEPSEIESIVRTRTRPRREALHKRILWFGSEPFRAARFEPELNSNQNPAANPPKSNLSFEREPDAAVRRFTSEFYGSDPNHSAPRGSNPNHIFSLELLLQDIAGRQRAWRQVEGVPQMENGSD